MWCVMNEHCDPCRMQNESFNVFQRSCELLHPLLVWIIWNQVAQINQWQQQLFLHARQFLQWWTIKAIKSVWTSVIGHWDTLMKCSAPSWQLLLWVDKHSWVICFWNWGALSNECSWCGHGSKFCSWHLRCFNAWEDSIIVSSSSIFLWIFFVFCFLTWLLCDSWHHCKC